MSVIFAQALLWPVLAPLAGSAICALAWHRPALQRVVSLVSLVLMLAGSLLLLFEVEAGGTQMIAFGGWPVPFGIVFVADQLGAAMALITAILALAIAVFGLADIRRRQEHSGFHPLYLGMIAAVAGAFLTGDVFNLYVWFEIMLITAMGLLAIDRNRAQLDGTLKYAVLNLLGTLLFLLAVGILYGATGTLNMADLGRVLADAEPSAALALAAALFLVAFGIKAGYFPLFFWLPASYHTASIVVSAIFAGLITKVGVYASFRVFTLLFSVDEGGIRELVAVMAAGTMVFGVFGAAVQWDIRRILSFHIISQIGYMMLGLALATPAAMAGAVFYIVHHIIVKANLFLAAGAIYRAGGTYDLRRSGGLLASHPMLALLFAVPALSLAGIPPLSGFWAKYMVIDAAFADNAHWLAGIGLFVGLLTVFSMSKIWVEAFWKVPPVERRHPRKVPGVMLTAMAALGLLTLIIGFMPEPLVDYANRAAESLLAPSSYVDAVLGPLTGDPS